MLGKYGSPEKVIDHILENFHLPKLVEFGLIDQEKLDRLNEELIGLKSLENHDEFTRSLLEALKPLMEAKIRDPKKYDEFLRYQYDQRNKFEKAGELVHYEIKGDKVYIHIAPGESLSGVAKLRDLMRGLEKIAQDIKDRDDISEIVGVSWIVAKNPGLIRKLGFDYSEDLTPEERGVIRYELQKYAKATMGRDEFLKKYLKNN